jgi:peroxiredoxin
MPKVTLTAQAPDFALNDYLGNPVCLADFRGQKHVVLVFNRGFM